MTKKKLPSHVDCPTCSGVFFIERSGCYRQAMAHVKKCGSKTKPKEVKNVTQRNLNKRKRT